MRRRVLSRSAAPQPHKTERLKKPADVEECSNGRTLYCTLYLSAAEQQIVESADVRNEYELAFERRVSRGERIRRLLAVAVRARKSRAR